ncbi:hypothetical protein E2C01_065105 [Portunus trituberculatus]|uniref:Uncharacterized protein n=1 Tax=Portunus trituberculatus TaxID=210409 RepID=A0A5B7HQU4_PORTR|nr:hypothetical protein [Portunus trituberculatus]
MDVLSVWNDRALFPNPSLPPHPSLLVDCNNKGREEAQMNKLPTPTPTPSSFSTHPCLQYAFRRALRPINIPNAPNILKQN